jgi:translation initiation factor 1
VSKPNFFQVCPSILAETGNGDDFSMTKKKDKLVYSTRSDAQLDRFPAVQGPVHSLPPHQQTISVMIDRKRRRGKTVTLCSGFVLKQADLKALEKELKQFCGAGGTSKDNEIEIQGEHRDKIMQKLTELNYKVKRVGG